MVAFADCCDRRLSSSIHCAALSGNSKVLKVLLSHGGDANAKAYAGATPLHISVSRTIMPLPGSYIIKLTLKYLFVVILSHADCV